MQLHLLTSNKAACSATAWAIRPKLASTVADVIACNLVITSCSMIAICAVFGLGGETVADLGSLTIHSRELDLES
jgi:hypothetical protein